MHMTHTGSSRSAHQTDGVWWCGGAGGDRVGTGDKRKHSNAAARGRRHSRSRMRLAPAAASAGTPPDSNLLPCCLPLLRCCLALLRSCLPPPPPPQKKQHLSLLPTSLGFISTW